MVRRLTPLLLIAVASPVSAIDPGQVDRSIGPQPKYTGKPAYCLVILGPDTRDRLWLVRDGQTLYADKNGNGDLTDPGEAIRAEQSNSSIAYFVGTIRRGKLEHRNLTVRAARLALYGEDVTGHPVAKAVLRKDRDADLMSVAAEVEVPGLKSDGDGGRLHFSARFDSDGPLVFAETTAATPVVHLGGPLRVRAELARPILYRSIVHDLMLTVGTPGVGPGTFASVGYEGLIPPEAFVVVEAEFAPAKPDGEAVRERYELKERC